MMKNLLFSIISLFEHIFIILLNKFLSFMHSTLRCCSIKILSLSKYVLILLFSFVCVFAPANDIPSWDIYELLEISENATQKEIKQAHLRFGQKYHPDRNGTNLSRLRVVSLDDFNSSAQRILNDNNQLQKEQAFEELIRQNVQSLHSRYEHILTVVEKIESKKSMLEIKNQQDENEERLQKELKIIRDMYEEIVNRGNEQGSLKEIQERILEGLQQELREILRGVQEDQKSVIQKLKKLILPEIQELSSRLLQNVTEEKGLEFDKTIERLITEVSAAGNKAKEWLYDSNKRAIYDETRKRGIPSDGISTSQRGETSAQQRSSVPTDLHLEEVRWFDVQLKPAEDPYRVLGIRRSAEERLIREKYEFLTDKITREITKEERKKKKESRGFNQEKISELNRIYSAYRILSHPEWRQQYDFNSDRTINIRGRHFVFVDQVSQGRFEFFESINGEMFDVLFNEKGEKVLVRGVLFPPPETQTAIERFMGTPITAETVIKVAGEKLKFDLVSTTEIEELKAIEADQRRRSLEDVVTNLKNRIAQNRSIQEKREALQKLRRELNEKWSSLKSSAQDQVRNIFQNRNSSTAVVPFSTDLRSSEASRSSESSRFSSTAHSFEPNRLTWEELYRMTHPNSEHAGSSTSRILKRMAPETLTFFGALGAFMFAKTFWDSNRYDGVEIDPEWAETLTAQMTSPLGVFSFLCFIMAAGQTNILLEKWVNKHIKTKYNLSKAGINTGIAAQRGVTEEHRKAVRQMDQRNSRFLRLLSVSRTAFTLSAGMMASTAVHEFFVDPNNQACWKGIMDKERRSFDFIETCDKAYSEWKAVFKTLIAVPTAVGGYYIAKNKLKLSPLERTIAKGILGVSVVLLVSNGLDDFGKLGDWGPDLVTMVAAGYSASIVTNGVRWGWGKRDWLGEKLGNIGQNIRDKWNQKDRGVSTSRVTGRAVIPTEVQTIEEGRVTGSPHSPSGRSSSNLPALREGGNTGFVGSSMNSNRWSKVKNMMGGLTKFGRSFTLPGFLLQGALSLPHLVLFFGFHELYHPGAVWWKNANLSSDIFDQQMKINSYTGRSLQAHFSEEQDFEFWEGDPAEDCALSDPQDMNILDIAKETLWNSDRRDCPGRYFSHQLNIHSNLLSDWRQNQIYKFYELNQFWQRDQAEARLGYEAVTNILFDGIAENAGLLSSDQDLRKGWTDVYYHNVRDDYKIKRINDEEKIREITEKTISENEVCQEADRVYKSCGPIEEGEVFDFGGIENCESVGRLIDSCSEAVKTEFSKAEEAEFQVEALRIVSEVQALDEGADESDSNNQEYLQSAVMKFKWAVQQIDQYIDAQENKDQFQFNNSVLTDLSSDKYLNSTVSLSGEEQLGTLRALFNAVDHTDLSKYYSLEQVEQCTRDENCNEDVLRVRAVSAGVDLLNTISIRSAVSKTNRKIRRSRRGAEIKYSHLIEEIREIFKTQYGENPQTYSTSSDFTKLNQGMKAIINQHRQTTEESTGMFSTVVPLMDSFHVDAPMKYILYKMVCGDDLTHTSLPSAESAKCSTQEDLEQLAEKLPSFEDGGEYLANRFQTYTFRIPKLIKGQAPAGICEKNYRTAFDTSFTVNGSEYKNLLEFVLDSRNMKTDVEKFWEEKVEKQYILLMGCFETQYKKIYTDHFVSKVHSEEVDKVVKSGFSSSPPSISASTAYGYPAPRESIEMEQPKGVLKSMMSQADYLLNRLQDIHHYPQSFESVDCSDFLQKFDELDEKTLKICTRKKFAVDFTFGEVKKRLGVCSHIDWDRDYSMQEKADISIECFREMILNLFGHIGERIKSQQCLTPDIRGMRSGAFPVLQNINWSQQFDLVAVLMQALVPPDVSWIMQEKHHLRINETSTNITDIMVKRIMDPARTKQDCLKDNWCPLYILPFRDSASFLVIRHLSSIFDQLVYLHHQVSLFSSHIAVSEECNEDYQSNPDNSTLIQQSADLFYDTR